MKVVLDTNVVVSGLIQSKGNPARILSLALAGAVEVCHDDRILAEYAEVLARPRFNLDSRRVREVLAKLETDGLRIDVSEIGKVTLPDIDDEPFLEVARAASACLITGNIADFPEDKRKGCLVLRPAEFIEYWQKLQSKTK